MLSVIVAVETEFLVELLINQIVFTVSFPSISMRVCVLLTLQVPIRISTGLNPDYGELTKLPGLIITSHLSQHPLINNNFKGADKKKSKKKKQASCVYRRGTPSEQRSELGVHSHRPLEMSWPCKNSEQDVIFPIPTTWDRTITNANSD